MRRLDLAGGAGGTGLDHHAIQIKRDQRSFSRKRRESRNWRCCTAGPFHAKDNGFGSGLFQRGFEMIAAMGDAGALPVAIGQRMGGRAKAGDAGKIFACPRAGPSAGRRRPVAAAKAHLRAPPRRQHLAGRRSCAPKAPYNRTAKNPASILPAAGTASTSSRAPASCTRRATSAIGCTTPVSLLAAITATRARPLPSRNATRRPSRSITPSPVDRQASTPARRRTVRPAGRPWPARKNARSR